MKVALMLALFGASICFAGCAEKEAAKVEHKEEVQNADGTKTTVEHQEEVTSKTE